jgi:RNA polymerase sigma factor (sigma-70 family)
VENSRLDPNMIAYERHLWQVLAALGRAGYFVPPQDARDLIHDFYLEQWGGLLQRYDANRSQFATYMAAAFYRFARRRIIQLERWRRRTVDLEDTAELESAAAMPDQLLESSEQLALIRAQLAALPAQEREVLVDFLASGDAGERALAQRHSLTRYRVRETLANAVGRLLVALAADAVPTTRDARIAKSLWVDGLTARQVASMDGIDTAEVNAARLRFVAKLMQSLREFNHPIKSVRKAMNSDIEILKSALFSDGDAAALARVREHAATLLAAIDRDDIDLALDEQQTEYLAAHPKWVGEVYAALGVDDGSAAEESELQQAIAEMMQNEARQIGEAFAMLVEALAEGGYRWARPFEPLRGTHISAIELMHMMEDDTVRYGGEPTRQLLEFGLTPGRIYGATRGLYLQFSRLSRLMATGTELPQRHAENDGAAFCIAGNQPTQFAFLSKGLAHAGIAGTGDMPEQAVEPLLSWIKGVLPRVPGLIEGYRWEGESGGVDLLVPLAQRPADLVAQWSGNRSAILKPGGENAALSTRWLSDA